MRNYGLIKEKLTALTAPHAHPVYRSAYIHVWQYRYAAEVCDDLGIAWEYNQRVHPAIVEDTIKIHPHDVASWLGMQPRHFQNLRTVVIKSLEALNQLEIAKGGGRMDRNTEHIYDIFLYFLKKDFLHDVLSSTAAPPHVLQAVRSLSWEAFKKQCKAIINH